MADASKELGPDERAAAKGAHLGGRARFAMYLGLLALVVSAFDPLEGSFLLVPAALVVALVARRVDSRSRHLVEAGLGLVGVGAGAMWLMTAIGGVGGNTDYSAWWALFALPIVPGWVLCVAGALAALRERRSGPD